MSCNIREYYHLLQLINFGLFVLGWVQMAILYFALENVKITVDSDAFVSGIRAALTARQVYSDTLSINAFLCWMKVFKYLSYIPRFGMLGSTLKNASGYMKNLSIIFLIFLFGSAQMYLLLYGSLMRQFRQITTGMYNLVRYLLGDFEFQEMMDVNGGWTPLAFSVFMIFGIFILLNMFIAIIYESYALSMVDLRSKQDVGLDQFTQDMIETILYEYLFRIPIFGWILNKIYDIARMILKKKDEETEVSIDSDSDVEVVAEPQSSTIIHSKGLFEGEKEPSELVAHPKEADITVNVEPASKEIEDRKESDVKEDNGQGVGSLVLQKESQDLSTPIQRRNQHIEGPE